MEFYFIFSTALISLVHAALLMKVQNKNTWVVLVTLAGALEPYPVNILNI